MGVQRYVLRSGMVRYRARVKFHGREVATRVFERPGRRDRLGAGPASAAAPRRVD